MVDVYDANEKIELTLPSRKQKVNASKAFFEDLETQNLHYKIN